MERRTDARYALWLPVRVEELTEGIAVTHDASQRGVRIVCRSTLEVGAEVTIAFRLPPDFEEEREIHGRVVRVSDNDKDPHGLWPKLMGVEFEEPVADLEAALAAVQSPARSSDAPPSSGNAEGS